MLQYHQEKTPTRKIIQNFLGSLKAPLTHNNIRRAVHHGRSEFRGAVAALHQARTTYQCLKSDSSPDQNTRVAHAMRMKADLQACRHALHRIECAVNSSIEGALPRTERAHTSTELIRRLRTLERALYRRLRQEVPEIFKREKPRRLDIQTFVQPPLQHTNDIEIRNTHYQFSESNARNWTHKLPSSTLNTDAATIGGSFHLTKSKRTYIEIQTKDSQQSSPALHSTTSDDLHHTHGIAGALFLAALSKQWNAFKKSCIVQKFGTIAAIFAVGSILIDGIIRHTRVHSTKNAKPDPELRQNTDTKNSHTNRPAATPEVQPTDPIVVMTPSPVIENDPNALTAQIEAAALVRDPIAAETAATIALFESLVVPGQSVTISNVVAHKTPPADKAEFTLGGGSENNLQLAARVRLSDSNFQLHLQSFRTDWNSNPFFYGGLSYQSGSLEAAHVARFEAGALSLAAPEAKRIDPFALAYLKTTHDPTRTTTLTLEGNAGYVSPEHWQNKKLNSTLAEPSVMYAGKAELTTHRWLTNDKKKGLWFAASVAGEGDADTSAELTQASLRAESEVSLLARPALPADLDLRSSIALRIDRERHPQESLTPGLSLDSAITGRVGRIYGSLGAETFIATDNQWNALASIRLRYVFNQRISAHLNYEHAFKDMRYRMPVTSEQLSSRSRGLNISLSYKY